MNILSKKNWLIAASALVLAGVIFYSLQDKGGPTNRGKAPIPPQEQEALDLGTLKNTSAPWNEQSQAMMRLSNRQNPEAWDFLKTKIKDKDERIATVATRALGFYTTPDALELLRTQLRSESSMIRMAAIDALGMRPQPEKLKIIDESAAFLKTDEERARLKMASMRLSTTPEDKSRVAKTVIADLQKKDLDPKARSFMINQIFFLSPHTPEVEAYFTQLSSKFKSTDEPTMLAAIRALKVYCPADRLSLFRDALSREGLSLPGKSQILSELAYHSGPKTKDLFDSATRASGMDAKLIENLTKRMEDPKLVSPCDQKKSPVPVPVPAPGQNR